MYATWHVYFKLFLCFPNWVWHEKHLYPLLLVLVSMFTVQYMTKCTNWESVSGPWCYSVFKTKLTFRNLTEAYFLSCILIRRNFQLKKRKWASDIPVLHMNSSETLLWIHCFAPTYNILERKLLAMQRTSDKGFSKVL